VKPPFKLSAIPIQDHELDQVSGGFGRGTLSTIGTGLHPLPHSYFDPSPGAHAGSGPAHPHDRSSDVLGGGFGTQGQGAGAQGGGSAQGGGDAGWPSGTSSIVNGALAQDAESAAEQGSNSSQMDELLQQTLEQLGGGGGGDGGGDGGDGGG
jgi:hypothetical protein